MSGDFELGSMKYLPFEPISGYFGSGSWLPPATIVRYDPTTCSNVPVTQAWVDEVCAKLEALQLRDPVADRCAKLATGETKRSEQDRMWAAVVAVS